MIRPPPPGPPVPPFLRLCLLLAVTAVTTTYGGCQFPAQWTGRWFQSGFGILQLNRSTIETKGECVDSAGDKFVVHDRSDDCYRCMVIHEKHPAVLQYKETYCDQKASLQELCYSITGDAPLYSMFRKSPEIRPVPCPFKAAPFTFSYNRGTEECANPPSRAESCTDDSRLVLKYQACPDIQSTESNVEELVCVATWKEGSTRYLVGRVNQVSRHSAVPSDEDQYRCFIYERVAAGPSGGNRVTYHVAQSGDATCNGLQNSVEGSRTMRLTTADTHHGRCRFPAWITDHHTWLSLDHAKTYKFSSRNATLRITATTPNPVLLQASTDRTMGQHMQRHHNGAAEGPTNTERKSDGESTHATLEEESEVRVVCHSILQAVEGKRVQIVAHITAGCESGFVCMVFHKRDASVIEIQQPEGLHENTDDACRYFDPTATPYTTLISPALHPSRCPHPGRYTVLGAEPAPFESTSRRKRQENSGPSTGVQQLGSVDGMEGGGTPPQPECLWHDYEALNVGCGAAGTDIMEFRSTCQHQPISAYTCHGSWQENNTHFLIASPVARRSTDALRYCLVYTFDGEGLGSTPTTGNTPGASYSNSHGSQLGASMAAAGGRTSSASTTTNQGAQAYAPPPHTIMRLSGLADSCHRFVVPGASGLWRFNFTTNGGCTRLGATGAGAPLVHPSLLLLFCGALWGLYPSR